jgi:ATP-binding cassette subfamily F protein 3
MGTSGAAKTDLEYRSLLGCFLFGGEEVEKKIRVLSGGEKARVALAKTIVSKANFLMLDEPTNHLDMHSVDLLVEALNKYEGSIILVSHDRYFISKVANVYWEIIDHKIREFRGTWEEYLLWKEKVQLESANNQAVNGSQQPKIAEKKESIAQAPSTKKAEENQPKGKPFNKELQKEYQKHQRNFEAIENQIVELKKEMENLEALLAHPDTYNDSNKFKATEVAYSKAKAQLKTFQADSEKVFEKMMEAEEALNV